MDRQQPFFHVSSVKEHSGNDPDRFTSWRIDKPAPTLIDNAKVWEAEDILDYRLENNRHEFLVHWKGYERGDDFWEPSANLKHSLALIQEYWNASHPTEPTPEITSHYVKTVWEPLEVSTTPCEASIAPDHFWELYDHQEYDSSNSDVDYLPIYNIGLLWHQDEYEESERN